MDNSGQAVSIETYITKRRLLEDILYMLSKLDVCNPFTWEGFGQLSPIAAAHVLFNKHYNISRTKRDR